MMPNRSFLCWVPTDLFLQVSPSGPIGPGALYGPSVPCSPFSPSLPGAPKVPGYSSSLPVTPS